MSSPRARTAWRSLLESSRLYASTSEEAPGRKEYACFFSVRQSSEPLWYRYGTGTTRFPRSAEAADGSTATYRYRSHDTAGVVRLVRCEIPATERAVELMDRRLNVRRAGDGTGGSVLMSDGAITLPGLEVNACQYGGDYPYCDPPPLELDDPAPPPEQQPCEMWASCAGGGGGSGSGGDEPEPTCSARTDPNCLQPLTSVDSTTIQQAMSSKLRTTFTDTIAQRKCGQLKAAFEQAYAAGMVFRGATTDSTHFGTTYLQKIHFDPPVLDGAAAGDTSMIREVAITGLHEAAHYLNLSHLAAGEPYWDSQGRDYYTSDPFKYLNPGPNSCVPR